MDYFGCSTHRANDFDCIAWQPDYDSQTQGYPRFGTHEKHIYAGVIDVTSGEPMDVHHVMLKGATSLVTGLVSAYLLAF